MPVRPLTKAPRPFPTVKVQGVEDFIQKVAELVENRFLASSGHRLSLLKTNSVGTRQVRVRAEGSSHPAIQVMQHRGCVLLVYLLFELPRDEDILRLCANAHDEWEPAS
jgi:hypothetical protein